MLIDSVPGTIVAANPNSMSPASSRFLRKEVGSQPTAFPVDCFVHKVQPKFK